MPDFEQQPKKELSLETPEEEAERLGNTDTSRVDLTEEKNAQETSISHEVLKTAATEQAAADEQAASELLQKIKGVELGHQPVVSDTERNTAFEEASLINKGIDRRSADGKPLDAAALEKLRHASVEEIDKKVEVLQTESGRKYLAGELPPVTTPERIVSPEELQTNLKILEANIAKMDQIPESVLKSPEGQEATHSLMERMTDKLSGFREGIINKLATLDSWEGKDKMFKVLAGVGGAAILGPLVLQMARSKWPEVGVALDAAPDALQQFVHLDVWARLMEMVGKGDLLQDNSFFIDGGIEASNLMADISSGKEAFSSLQPEQLQILQNSIDPATLEWFTDAAKVAHANQTGYDVAAGTANSAVVARTLANIGPIGAAGIGIYNVMRGIGNLANKHKKKA